MKRPTPEEVVEDELVTDVEYGGIIDRHAAGIIRRLAEHGYVIVHPDDFHKPNPNERDLMGYEIHGEVRALELWNEVFGQ